MSAIRPLIAALAMPSERFMGETGEDRRLRSGRRAWDGESAGTERDRRVRTWKRLKFLGVGVFPSGGRRPVYDAAAMVGTLRPSLEGAERGGSRLDDLDRIRDRGLAYRKAARWLADAAYEFAPPLHPGQSFRLDSRAPVAEFLEAKLVGVSARPVLLGPVSFLRLVGSAVAGFDPLTLLPEIVPLWREVLQHLRRAGAGVVQLDEPCIADDADGGALDGVRVSYPLLAEGWNRPKIVLTPGFGDVSFALPTLAALPIAGLHLDLVNAPRQLDAALDLMPARVVLSLGLVDGAGADRSCPGDWVRRLRRVVRERGVEKLELAPSCPLRDRSPRCAASSRRSQSPTFVADRIGELERLADFVADPRKPADATFALALQ